MRLALHQTAGAPKEPGANLAALADTAARAAGEGARLLVLPELWLTGYNIGTTVHDLAEPAIGRAAEAVAGIAARHGVAILYGYPERAGEAVYNAAQLIGPGGEPVLNARKTHLYGSEERRLFVPGPALSQVVDVGGLRAGVLICYDAEFPEAARTLANAGAELLLVPTALFQPYAFVATHVVPVRAFENQVYVAYANRCGREGKLAYVGRSSVCGPDGAAVAQAEAGERLLLADAAPDALARGRRANPYLRDRRPDLYK